MCDTELAWAAGFFDGEGHSSRFRSKYSWGRRGSRSYEYTYVRASVRQNDRTVLERFCRAVGVGKIFGPYARQPESHEWRALAQGDVLKLMQRLWPYLSEPKKSQFINAAEGVLDHELPEPA